MQANRTQQHQRPYKYPAHGLGTQKCPTTAEPKSLHHHVTPPSSYTRCSEERIASYQVDLLGKVAKHALAALVGRRRRRALGRSRNLLRDGRNIVQPHCPASLAERDHNKVGGEGVCLYRSAADYCQPGTQRQELPDGGTDRKLPKTQQPPALVTIPCRRAVTLIFTETSESSCF